MPMLRYALRRFYLAVIGLLLLSLPLSAAIRAPVHNKTMCQLMYCDVPDRNPPLVLARNGPLYEIWQTGMPPNDWWPLAIALLAAEGAATLVLSRRHA